MTAEDLLILFQARQPASARVVAKNLAAMGEIEQTVKTVRELMNSYKHSRWKIFWCEVVHLLEDQPSKTIKS